MTEKGRTLTGNNITHTKMRKSLQMGLIQPFDPLESEGNHASVLDCTMATQYSWNDVPEMQLEEHKSLVHQFEDNFGRFPLHGKQNHIQVDHQSQSICSISSTPSLIEEDIAGSIETKPLYVDYKCHEHNSSMSSIGSAAVDTFPIEPGSLIMNDQSSEPDLTPKLGLKTEASNFSCFSDMKFYRRSLLLGGHAAAASLLPLEDYLHFCWLQGECSKMNFSLQNMSGYYDPGLIAEIPIHYYDSADYQLYIKVYS